MPGITAGYTAVCKLAQVPPNASTGHPDACNTAADTVTARQKRQTCRFWKILLATVGDGVIDAGCGM
jgi:hypothetical protein